MKVCSKYASHLLLTFVVGLTFVSSAMAANLLVNPSFEVPALPNEAPAGWVSFAGELGRHMWVEKGPDGGTILVIDTGGERNAGLRSEPIAAQSGDIYEASARVLAMPGNRPALYIDYWNVNKQRISTQSVYATKTGQWETLNVSLEAPPETEWVSIILYSNAGSAPGRVSWNQPSLVEDMSFQLQVNTERPDAVYELGETVSFVVSLEQGGKAVSGQVVEWQLTNDGVVPLISGTANVVGGEARVTGTLDQPGFLRVRVTLRTGDGPIVAQATAGVDPHAIQVGSPAPDDFDAFWYEQKAALAAVPAISRLTRVESAVANIEAFDVKVGSLGAPVSGYMARPVGAAAGSLPAIITLHGAGVRSAGLATATGWAKEGLLSFDVNAHGILNGQPASYYAELTEGRLNDYRAQGRESRETFYFLGMFLRVIRAIGYITSQPEWDGRTLILYGTSQGGAQALAGAGMDERVTFFAAGVPAMADMGGLVRNRPMRWDLLSMAPAEAQRIRETLAYFDGANFVSRSQADGFFTVGWLDDTSRPTTVYAAHNAVRGKKGIFNDIRVGHTNTTQALQAMREAVLHHVDEMKARNSQEP